MKLNFNTGDSFLVSSEKITPIPRGESTKIITDVTDKVQEAFQKLVEGYNSFSEKVIHGEIEFILKPIGIFIKDVFFSIIHLLNTYSVEIILLSIMGVSFGMMLSPLWGDKSSVWGGRLIAITIGGAIWRIVI